jgi:hypothetical protein
VYDDTKYDRMITEKQLADLINLETKLSGVLTVVSEVAGRLNNIEERYFDKSQANFNPSIGISDFINIGQNLFLVCENGVIQGTAKWIDVLDARYFDNSKQYKWKEDGMLLKYTKDEIFKFDLLPNDTLKNTSPYWYMFVATMEIERSGDAPEIVPYNYFFGFKGVTPGLLSYAYLDKRIENPITMKLTKLSILMNLR